VLRWATLVPPGRVLDVACGEGRHASFFLQEGFKVTAIDREPRSIPGRVSYRPTSKAAAPGAAGRAIRGDRRYQLPVPSPVPDASASLAPGGVLIYETFMLGNERFGKPSNPQFLLRPGELLEAFRDWPSKASKRVEVRSQNPQ
jgi:SAM-dependent methyltransferase